MDSATPRSLMVGFCFAVLLSGCGARSGPDTVDVSGTVTLDGQPLAGAEVNFMTDSFASFGKTGADGKYQLVQGAVVGPNKVVISKKTGGAPESVVPGYGSEGLDAGQVQAAAAAVGADPQNQAKATIPGDLVPAEFSDPAQTKLTFPVPEGGTDSADFKLTSK